MIHFTHFQAFQKIPKNPEIPKRVKSSNLGRKSLKVRALTNSHKFFRLMHM